MKIYRRYGATVIQSPTLITIAGFTSGGRESAKLAKAAAVFPFVIVRDEKYATPIFINHERIHFRQQIETMFVGSILLHLLEDTYSRLFLKLKHPDYYLYRACEQEAYRNQDNLNYLKNRPWFSIFKYITNKRRLSFITDRAPEVRVGETF